MKMKSLQVTKMYIIYAQIGFSTNRQTFNKNIAGGKISDFYVAQIIIQNRCTQCRKTE